MAWPWHGHGIAMAWPWRGHDMAMALPWHANGIAMALPWHCHGIAMAWPWHCRGNAMALPWHCRGIAMAWPWHGHGGRHSAGRQKSADFVNIWANPSPKIALVYISIVLRQEIKFLLLLSQRHIVFMDFSVICLLNI